MAVKYVIYHPQMEKFLTICKTGGVQWVPYCSAHRFQNKQAAINYWNQNFSGETKMDKKDARVCPCGADGSPVLDSSDSAACSQLSQEQAERYLEELSGQLDAVSKTAEIVAQLRDYYLAQVSLVDREQEDLLHKIEFTRASAVDGFKLYKQLHELRQRRRKYKDAYGLLDVFRASGFLDGAENLQKSVAVYREGLERRTYTPRVLEGLFCQKEKECVQNESAG